MNNTEQIQSLLDSLETSIVEVTFRTKSNGIRVMTCTRNLNMVPDILVDGINSDKINGPKIIGVYDMLHTDWRSFRKDSIESFKSVV